PFSHIYKQDDLPHLQSFPTRRSSDLSFGSPNDDEAEEHGDNGGRDPRVNAECVFNSRRNVIGLNSWYQEFSPITFLLLLNTHSALTRGSRPPLSPCSSASSSLGEPNERSEERRVGKDWRCGRSSCL